jgi:hypothetical protein
LNKTSRREFGSEDLAFTFAVAVVALLPRLFVAIAWSREPVWDGHYYHFGAERIAAGLGYSEDVMVDGQLVWKPWVHYPVGYSGLLGGVYWLFGSGLTVAPIANAVLGTLLVVVVHRLARHYLSLERARIAAAVAALHPGLIVYTALVMTEPLAALLLLCAAWAVLHWRTPPLGSSAKGSNLRSWIGIVVAGATLGISTLVRPTTLLAAPLLALLHPRPWFRALGRAAVAALVALLVVCPWTIRNCVRMDGCALVSTNGGWNLAIGALSQTGRFQTLRASDGCPVVTGQVQQDQCWAKVGMDAIERDVWRWVKLGPQKLAQTFDHQSFAIEYLREADPVFWPESRRQAARSLLTLFHRLLLAAAAFSVVPLTTSAFPAFRSRLWFAQVGMMASMFALELYAMLDDSHPFFLLVVAIALLGVLPLPGRPPQGPVGRYLIGVLATTLLIHVVFFGDDRYHIVVTPALCILAAAALRPPRLTRPAAIP